MLSATRFRKTVSESRMVTPAIAEKYARIKVNSSWRERKRVAVDWIDPN